MVDSRSQWLHHDEALQRAGQDITGNAATIQAAAWWLASELVRRHPGELVLAETHPAIYDCLSVYTMPQEPAFEALVPPHSRLIAHLNLVGSVTLGSWFEAQDQDHPKGFNWTEVVMSNSRRRYIIEQIERSERLPVPPSRPSTARSTLGPRVVSAFFSRTAFGRGSNASQRDSVSTVWQMRMGNDSGNAFNAERRTDWYQISPTLMEQWRKVEGDLRFWFLLDPSQHPVVALDMFDARAWTAKDEFDLFDIFVGNGRSVDSVVNKVFPTVQ